VPIAPLTADLLPAAAEVVAAQTARRIAAAGSSRGVVDLDALAERWLRSYVEDEDRFAFVALDGGTVAACLGALTVRLTPDDEGYTYMAPRHALCPLGGWAARTPHDAAAHLPALLDAVRSRASDEGIDRINLQTLDPDWHSGGVWRSSGLRPDTAFALRPLAAPTPSTHSLGVSSDATSRDASATGSPAGGAAPLGGPVTIRPAEASDADALTALALEEFDFHARHTGSGAATDQSPRTARRIVDGWFAQGDPTADTAAGTRAEPGPTTDAITDTPDTAGDHRRERALVATAGGDVVGVTTVQVLTAPANSLGALVLPARYGYVGLTVVAEAARGLGVGTALAAAALESLRAVPEPPETVGLHYVVDNDLSAPFWSARGFAPALTLLTSAPRHTA
jgi:GNAT superfamily N-acetyltransferase